MKKMMLLLVCLTGILHLNAQMAFTSLKLNPASPKQNSQLSFEYDKTNSKLEGKSDIDIAVYQFNSDGYKVTEPVITRKGNIYTGTVQIEKNTNFIAFGFSSGDDKDLNNDKGYLTPVYTDKNIPVQGYYATAANFQNFFGQYLLDLNVNTAEGLRILEEGIRQYPDIKNDPGFLNVYIGALGKSRNKEAATVIDAELASFAKKTLLTEQGYHILIQNSKKNNNTV